MSTFSAQVGDWVNQVKGALLVVFKESVQELASRVDFRLEDMVYNQPVSPSGYHRTGFLRASFMASKVAMPLMSRSNPGATVPANLGDVMLVINSMDLDEEIYLGYTANYAGFVHYGANGREPRPWVLLVAQQWDEIVAAKANETKTRLGL
jgi:hypothetical protein